MKKQIRSLTKQTLIYGMGTIATRLVTFLLLPVFTNILPDYIYGQAALIFTFLTMMNHVYNYGLDSAFMRYYSHEKDIEEKNKVLSSAMGMALVSSFTLSIFVFIFRNRLAEFFLDDLVFSRLFVYAAIVLFFDCLARIPFAYLRQERRPMIFMGVRFINVILTLALNVWFVGVMKQGIDGIFRSYVFVSIITTTLLYILMLKKIQFRFDSEIAKKLFFFGIPFVPSGLAVATMEMWNRIIIKQFHDLEMVGIFSANYKLGIFMSLVSTGFYYAWQPFFLKEGNKEESRNLFGRIMTYFIVVALTFWMILTIFLNDIINIHIGSKYLLGLEYQNGIKIVPFVLLGYLFLGINLVLLPGFYFEKKTRYLALITIIAAVINISFNYLLIPAFGIMGPGYAMIIGNISLITMSYFASQRLFKINYEYRRIFILFISCIFVGFAVYYWQPHVVAKIIIVLLLPLILKICKFFSPGELTLLRKLVNR